MPESHENLRPHADVVSRRVGDEVVLVHLQTDRMFSLNPTGARAWELLSEGDDLETVEAKLAQEFGVDQPRVQAELEVLLAELVRERLLERS